SRFPHKLTSLITNGVDVERFFPAARGDQKESVKKEFGIEDKFIVGYAGLHGLGQGLDTILRAARILSGHENLRFAFFGDGPEKEKLMQLTNHNALANVCFYPIQPTARMPEIISSFDIAVIPLKRLELAKGALPSKMFEAMAVAVPLIVSIEGEAHALV